MNCMTIGKFFGYYHCLNDFLSAHKYPEGVPGGCFINGETKSLWIWNAIERQWIDSNRVENALKGFIDSPTDFNPTIKPGIKSCYLYVAPEKGIYTFTHLDELTIEVATTAVLMLYWNGDMWEYAVTPINMDLSAYLSVKQADEEYVRVDFGNCNNIVRETSRETEGQSSRCIGTPSWNVIEQCYNDNLSWVKLNHPQSHCSIGISENGEGVIYDNDSNIHRITTGKEIDAINNSFTAYEKILANIKQEIGSLENSHSGDNTLWGSLLQIAEALEQLPNEYATKKDIPDISLIPSYRLGIEPTIGNTPTSDMQYPVTDCSIEGEAATVYNRLVACADMNIPIYIRYTGTP